jgi:hypothetical protein
MYIGKEYTADTISKAGRRKFSSQMLCWTECRQIQDTSAFSTARELDYNRLEYSNNNIKVKKFQ